MSKNVYGKTSCNNGCIADTPIDVQKMILYNLPFTDIINICQTNKTFRKICKSKQFWIIYFNNKNLEQFTNTFAYVLKHTKYTAILDIMKNCTNFTTRPFQDYLYNFVKQSQPYIRNPFNALPQSSQSFIIKLSSVHFRRKADAMQHLLHNMLTTIKSIEIQELLIKMDSNEFTDKANAMQHILNSVLIKMKSIKIQEIVIKMDADQFEDKASAIQYLLLQRLPEINNEETQELLIKLDSTEFTDKARALTILLGGSLHKIKHENIQELLITMDSREFQKQTKAEALQHLSDHMLEHIKTEKIRKLIISTLSGLSSSSKPMRPSGPSESSDSQKPSKKSKHNE
jgi:hypothetical protein